MAVAIVLACAPPPLPRAEVETGSGMVTLRLEIAETDEDRARGMIGRDRLPPDTALAFLWSEDTDVGFHMRGVRVPLSIAFFAADGRILRILDMAPCAADPCPAYSSGTRFRGVLEVDRGAFARLGIREGDRIRIVR